MVTRGGAGRPGPRVSRGHRAGVFATTAALAALAFSVVSTGGSPSEAAPVAQGQLTAAGLDDASAIQALNDPTNAVPDDGSASPRAASAVAEAQARVQSLAAQAAQEAQAAQAAQAAAARQAQASAPASDDGTAGPDAYRAYAKAKVGAAQFSCLDSLWTKESGWRPTAKNPHSTAYGIPQLLTATWAATGVPRTANGYRQVDAGLIYVTAAYGTPCAAWAHSKARGWY